MTATTIQIAQEYEQSGNLGNARGKLDALEVANPTQFLIFLAEGRASTDPGSAETAALVHLALAMGLQSGQLMDYAMQYGLLANTAAPTPEPITQPAAQSLAPVTSTEQTPTTDMPAATVVAAVPVESEQEATPGAVEEPVQEVEQVAEQAPAAANPLPTTTAQPPTATPISKPMIQASNGLNVRNGPGTAYPIAGALNVGEQADIVAKNPQGDWWQITLPTGGTGWVYSPLVQTMGDTSTIAVASDIPAAPPTPTPAPVAEIPAEQPPAEQPPAEQPPVEEPPAEEPPVEEAPPPVADGPDFASIERRLWTVQETGGRIDSGGSVACGEKRELHVIVLDANGSRLNGVAVQALYGAQEIFVTGNQGKGEGKVEFVLGEGQGVKVISDADGREVTSDVVDGMTTHSPKISHEDLIKAHYCTDTASCNKFNESAGCWGHHSWTVTFQRKY